MQKDVVGFHDESNSIITKLLRGSKKLQIVAIVGMPGLGKTTLAEKVYNDPSILLHFPARAFTTVSQAVDKKRVFTDILKQVSPEKYIQLSSESTADEVTEQVRPYLIVLDDLWEAEACKCLQQSFPDDFLGSRIMFTSHHHDVAPRDILFEGKPHKLRRLNEDESQDLLQRKLYGGNITPTGLGDLRRQLAEICNGFFFLGPRFPSSSTKTQPPCASSTLQHLTNSTQSLVSITLEAT
ncbi:OLC1v1031770C1 [Oldenlandia corymbosa var. corymbosa]|uniref:OLC1v1031770C1 n=1 Tax=Oldenlandia corymbosa var. corymbosa TaxID=529605 RepID=A0AAV1CJ74_OLDCO|nr:OLC1v1031770C1 [Oldenlandia corymbosa var. corymbosa]